MAEIRKTSDPLDNLDHHWKKVPDEMQNQSLTRKMVIAMYQYWKYAIENYYVIQSEFSRYTKQQQWEKIEQIENLEKLTRYKATENYRNAE